MVVILVGWLWTPDLDRGKLESRYSNAAADFIYVAGIQLHLRDSGPKTTPALILLHGFGSSLHTWDPWAGELGRDCRVIRFDLPGAGLTGADLGGDYSVVHSLQILAALMDRLGLAKASLVGNLIVGRIAWRFATEFPTRVAKLILVSPDGFASPASSMAGNPICLQS